jgi:trehalose 6-phosphate synthase/phosphatase
MNSSIKGINKVNIYDINSIINGLENIIYKKTEINNEIISKNVKYIKKNDILNWSKSFFLDLKKASDTYNDSSTKIGMSLGLNFFLMKLNSKFSHLNKNDLIEAYRNSNKCLMFLNYEGTLQLIDENDEKDEKELFKPNETILTLLNLLTSNPKNKIYIVSGREKTLLEKWFGNIPKLGIAA